ncbi:MAG: 50S ribosomal protein L3 [Nanoarchaeota archaeon]|nr:50S ribosomal protein L3 [Nanoarchaeota archaeon]MBU4352479.1 50S ribosomal protein L3 [Nanoarchaeota archaeon]MBU4455992.1 50S ribosomal protein L3 [Nanoarchaeota archaeon]MCG2719411.1 50S ribosomal protein L3 [Nanoarchaeota archaeon]
MLELKVPRVYNIIRVKMGGSNRSHHPHRGSMQFWPRKRATRVLARVRNWVKKNDELKLLGFVGYKVGMTHASYKEQNNFSKLKGKERSTAVTVIECPPLKALSIRFYKNTNEGLKVVGEYFATKVDKEVKRKARVSKKQDVPTEFDDVRLLVYSQPKLTGTGKKTPDVLELGISGADAQAKLEFAKNLLDKEIKVSDIFHEGQLIDIHGVTKGKGFQGTVKRYGVKRRSHKSEKTIRGIGTLGSWTPKRVEYTVAQPGKMGFHQRTEYNKLCLKISDKHKEINQDGGFLHYGVIKNDYLLIKGSVTGSANRQVVLSEPMRKPIKFKENKPELTYISTRSKQGR